MTMSEVVRSDILWGTSDLELAAHVSAPFGGPQ
jgi:hypothetical protein